MREVFLSSTAAYILLRAQLVAAPAPHMSPITRRQSQRHMPLPQPRGMVTAPKPTYSQVVTGLARDPGKGHVTVARDPGKGHVTAARDPGKGHVIQARASMQVIARDRAKIHVTEARDLSQDQTRPHDQTRFLRATRPLIGTWKTVESSRRNVTVNYCGAAIAAQSAVRLNDSSLTRLCISSRP